MRLVNAKLVSNMANTMYPRGRKPVDWARKRERFHQSVLPTANRPSALLLRTLRTERPNHGRYQVEA